MMNEAKAANVKRLAKDVDTILDKLYDEKITDSPKVQRMIEDLLGTWKALVAQCDFDREAAVKAVKAADVDLKELRKYLD